MIKLTNSTKDFELNVPEDLKELSIEEIKKAIDHVILPPNTAIILNVSKASIFEILNIRNSKDHEHLGFYLLNNNIDDYKDIKIDDFYKVLLSPITSNRAVVLKTNFNNTIDDILSYIKDDKNIINNKDIVNKKYIYTSFIVIPKSDIICLEKHSDFKSSLYIKK